MITVAGREYQEVWLVDFEFNGNVGDIVQPVCLVAHEFGSGRTLRLWADQIHRQTVPPYAIGAETLFVAYYASAELGCHLALGWALPQNVLDLFAEFRTLTNGTQLPAKAGLLGALAWYGIEGISGDDKDAMRDRVLLGGPFSETEREAILDYCESDVVSLIKLLPAMEGALDLPRALLPGRYMRAAACMEHVGIPIDLPALEHLRSRWADIQADLIAVVDVDYGVYEGQSFREDRFSGYLALQGIAWPRLPSGRDHLCF